MKHQKIQEFVNSGIQNRIMKVIYDFFPFRHNITLSKFFVSGHRAHTVFVGVHMPGSRRHSHRRHKHHHKDGEKASEYDRPSKCVV